MSTIIHYSRFDTDIQAPQLHWQANAKQMYKLSIDTRLDFSFTDDFHSTLIQKIEGILNFRIFTINRNGVGVGFQLSPINYMASGRKQPQVEKALSSPFSPPDLTKTENSKRSSSQARFSSRKTQS